jgi:hypothetical protein
MGSLGLPICFLNQNIKSKSKASAMETNWTESLREKLDGHYVWPDLYVFKFIVPKGNEEAVKSLFPRHTVKEKTSKNGNYTSLTIEMMVPSSDVVIDIYLKTTVIEGLIAL